MSEDQAGVSNSLLSIVASALFFGIFTTTMWRLIHNFSDVSWKQRAILLTLCLVSNLAIQALSKEKSSPLKANYWNLRKELAESRILLTDFRDFTRKEWRESHEFSGTLRWIYLLMLATIYAGIMTAVILLVIAGVKLVGVILAMTR